jgi:hypothetical protein
MWTRSRDSTTTTAQDFGAVVGFAVSWCKRGMLRTGDVRLVYGNYDYRFDEGRMYPGKKAGCMEVLE